MADYDEIDPAIRQLIVDLNAAGYTTFSSCQGKRSPEDFESGSHTDHAFISFEEIPVGLKRNAWRYGLSVYNGGMSICPEYSDQRQTTYTQRNRRFEERVRRLFKLEPKPP